MSIWRGSRLSRRRNITGYLFILPWIVGFTWKQLGPFIYSFVLSFYQWPILIPPTYKGLSNYVRLFQDEIFWKVVVNTLYYVGGSVLFQVIISLLIAIMLFHNKWLTETLKAFFYLPIVSSAVAMALIWTWLYDPEYGLINNMLGVVGIQGPNWLASTAWAMPSLILMSGAFTGVYIIIFYAGLQGIPDQLYEVAEIDGAGRWMKFAYITVPMLSPIVFLVIILSVIESFQVFTRIYIMTEGGPAAATLVYIIHFYWIGFRFFKFGYASAMAWIFFIVLAGFTLFQWKLRRKWVFTME